MERGGGGHCCRQKCIHEMLNIDARPYWLIFLLADVDQQCSVGKGKYVGIKSKTLLAVLSEKSYRCILKTINAAENAIGNYVPPYLSTF